MTLCKLHQVRHHIRTGAYACVGHRPPNSPSNPDVTIPNVGEPITQAYITNLRAIIRAEIVRWKQHVDSHPTSPLSQSYAYNVYPDPDLSVPIPQGGEVQNHEVNNIFNAINHVDNMGPVGHALQYPPQNPAASPDFKAGPSDDVVPSLADFATSDGNYIRRSDIVSLVNQYRAIRMDCICHSDCMCNNVCNCHSDCVCHYSDMRLKKEIQYC